MNALSRRKRKRPLESPDVASTSKPQSKVQHVDTKPPPVSRAPTQQTSERSEPVISSGRITNKNPLPTSSQSRAVPDPEPVIQIASTSRHEPNTTSKQEQIIDDSESVFTSTRNTGSGPQTVANQTDPVALKLYSAISISQLFNQFMSSQKCVSEKKLNHILEAYNKRYTERSTKTLELKSLISRYNRLFRTDGWQIKRTYDPIGQTYYYIVSGTFDGKLSKMNTWSQKESSYYFLVLDEIFTSFIRNVSEDDEISDPASGDYSFLSISINIAVNLSRRVTGTHITMTMAEKLLNRWVPRNWFTFTDSARRITVGIRTLSLMSTYLNTKFSIYLCNVCTFTCLIGITCPKCRLCIHYHCLESSTVQAHPCPVCNVPMSGVQYLVPTEVHEEMEVEE